MRRNFRLTGLDCGYCAANLERAIAKIEGVQACTVNFMTLKLTVEVADESADDILAEVARVANKANVRLVRC